ncbi:MAG: glucosaminidase domain-containing protein [Bacteroidota bacterium]
MKPADFLNTYGDSIVMGTEGFKLFPSVKAAQMALETSWGEKIKGNNAFGIKAAGATSPYWKGKTIEFSTTEYINNIKTAVTAVFRNYASLGDSIADHSYFLAQNKRYTDVLKATTPEDQAKALQAAGYATDPDYASKLISIINSNNFKVLDQKKKL